MSQQADAQRPHDWYTVLGVDPLATHEHIASAVERLARQANALSITAPERARQLRDQVRAIKQDLLSGPEQRARYDLQLATQVPADPAGAAPAVLPPPGGGPANAGPATRPGIMSRFTQFLQTGWTCTSCGYGALPTDKFCPKCGGKILSGVQGRPASCATCGNRMALADAFCTKCGTVRS
jgi:hypothetical protein